MTRIPEGSPLARALERGRERYNALFERARVEVRGLDADTFLGVLATRVSPAVQAVADIAPDRAERATEALYELALGLTAKGLLGAGTRVPLADRAWAELLPRIPSHLAASPRKVAAALTNAAVHLGEEPGARAEAWLLELAALAPLCPDPETLLRSGQALAWRCGMAHLREGALALLDAFPDPLLAAVLGLGRDLPRPREAVLATLHSEPWLPPGAELPARRAPCIVGRAGGFRGFGGPFVTPPDLFAVDGRIFALDAENCWTLHADHFGVTVRRYGPDLPPGDSGRGEGFSLERDGTVRTAAGATSLPALADPSSWACTPDTLAVSFRSSHRIFLVGVA